MTECDFFLYFAYFAAAWVLAIVVCDYLDERTDDPEWTARRKERDRDG
jgi:hypothetical protein